MAVRWKPVEYGVAKLLLEEHDWSYNNIGREIHRTKIGVINKLKGPEKYREPRNMTSEDWMVAKDIVQKIVTIPHVPGELNLLESDYAHCITKNRQGGCGVQ